MSARASLSLVLAILACVPPPPAQHPAAAAEPVAAAREPEPAARAPRRWRGAFALPTGAELPFFVVIEPHEDGWRGTVDIPLQGARNVPLERVTIEGGKAEFVLGPPVAARWGGPLSADGSIEDCELEQHGTKLSCTMDPIDEVAYVAATRVERPQLPKPPFPYAAREVTFRNDEAGVELAGTLTLPEKAGPHPAVVLVSGSGAQDRDETIFDHKPFAVIADTLTRRGIAVLRFDDRGVGGSQAGPPGPTSEDFAGDVRAAVAMLRADRAIDPARVGILGHSEGGAIAPMVAAGDRKVAFIVLLAGPGVPGHDLIVRQVEQIAEAAGMPKAEVEAAARSQREIVDLVRKGKDDATVRTELDALLGKHGVGDESARAVQIELLMSPWYRWFLRHDPAPVLAKVRCPVLAVGGDKDTQVDAAVNLAAIERALEKGGNKRIRIERMAGLNHLLQSGAKTGGIEEYAEISETMSPQALTIVADWIATQVAGRR